MPQHTEQHAPTQRAATPGEIVIGLYLRAAREGAGMRVRHAAAKAGMSTANLSRIERGEVQLPQDVMARLLRAYGLRDVRFLETLGRELPLTRAERVARGGKTRFQTPGPVFVDIAPGADERYALCHQAALAVTSYTLSVLPRPFRTRAYDRVVLAAREEVSARPSPLPVTTTVHRPGDGQEMTLLVDQRVLEAPVGGAQLMAAQLRHLIEIMDAGTATIRVVPYTSTRVSPSPYIAALTLPHGQRLIARWELTPWYTSGSPEAHHTEQLLDELATQITSPQQNRALLLEAARQMDPGA